MPKTEKVQTLEFRGRKLLLGRKTLGEVTRRQKGLSSYMFYPTPTGERMGLVRAFACPKGVVGYVSDYLLANEKLTMKQWRAARRIELPS